MLVARYDINDSIVDSKYDELLDALNWDKFRDIISNCLFGRSFPMHLVIGNNQSNPDYFRVNSIKDIVDKLSTFDSPYYEIHKFRNSYEFFILPSYKQHEMVIKIRSINSNQGK